MSASHTQTRLYCIWSNMKQRCFNPNNPKYSCYGGRGITVCDEWKNSFRAFSEWSLNNGYEDPPMDATKSWISMNGLTIDRIDSDKGYSPENCRWITFQQNRLNRKEHYYYTHKNINEFVEWMKKEAENTAEVIPELKKWENSMYKSNTVKNFTAFLLCRKFHVYKSTMMDEEDVPKAREFAEKVFLMIRELFTEQ